MKRYTNLPRDEFPTDVLRELYQMRWGIETAFKELKHNVGLANIHSKKTNFVFQEIYAKLIMYNFAALIAYAQTVPDETRINFAKSMYVCYQFFKEKQNDIVLLKMILSEGKMSSVLSVHKNRKMINAIELHLPFFCYIIIKLA